MKSLITSSVVLSVLTIFPACYRGQTDDLYVETLSSNLSLSDCGGFQDLLTMQAEDDYCEAERIYWTYDSDQDVLSLRNSRVSLNCCGDRSVTAQFWSGGEAGWRHVVIQEEDAPGDQGRCRCQCVFDFDITVHDVAQFAENGTLSLILYRQIMDEDDYARNLKDERIDLSQGSGSFVVSDESAEPWCSENPVDR